LTVLTNVDQLTANQRVESEDFRQRT
jgi:hypothetical protein